MKPLLLALSVLVLPLALPAAEDAKKPETLTAKAAKDKVGESVTLEDTVAEVNRTDRIIRLNLGARFPKQDLTLVIFQKNFPLFEEAVKDLSGKKVRATGKVTEYQKRAQIVLERPDQLIVLKGDKAPADDKK
ncbi:MAG: hypothetical protein RJA22_3062 [Verrucomicrobiota bacterium]|jgi:DNA/RNA endonuclease YhcR with UshA esterase domain